MAYTKINTDTATKTASGSYGGKVPANAFDGSLATMWNSGTWGGWIQLQFTSQEICNRIKEYHTTYTFIFKIQGSNNGTDWTDLVTSPSHLGNQWNTLDFSNTTAYYYYRYYVTDSGGGWVDIAEWELWQDMSTHQTILSNANILGIPRNTSFENWTSTGTPGSVNGVCDFWDAYSENGGTSTRQTDAPTGGGTYSANLRSNAAGNISSVGGLTSELFYLNENHISFYEKSENGNVEINIKIFDEFDNLLGWWYLPASSHYVGYWGRWNLSVPTLIGQNIKIRFDQHTLVEGSGYYSLIDLVYIKTRRTLLSNANVLQRLQQTILSDAEVTPHQRQYINSDSKIKVLNNQQTILSDSKILQRVQKTILSNSSIKVLNIQKFLYSNAKVAILVLKDILNKFNSCKQVLKDIENKFTFAVKVISDIENHISTCKSKIYDTVNDFRTKKLNIKNINNDVRFLKSWGVPGLVGFQSLGKTYIHVYIGGIEQTDVNVDSININKILNGAHTASFDLAKAYDSTEPTLEASVEIKYNTYILFRGYVIGIRPSANPEFITVECSDEYWKQNRGNVYFFVGHRPTDNKEKYYNTPQEALSAELGWNPGIGNFVPEVINCFAVEKSDAISSLIQNSGNYAWFYDVNNNKILWQAGEGSIITIERQSIGKNIGLYQLLDHTFTKTVENLVNKYRVQMGDKIISKLNDKGATRTRSAYNYSHPQGFLTPAWGASYEKIASKSSDGYGFDYPKPGYEKEYGEVFKKYKLPFIDKEKSSWADRFPPVIKVHTSGGYYYAPIDKITEGFTIDYENGFITFNEPQVDLIPDTSGEIHLKRYTLEIYLSKKDYYTVTESPTENPETDVSNPLMFFTDKMGSYPDTIMKDLDLSNLSIQIGGITYNADGEMEIIPSWNDTEYAKDFANWQLSKICDKKITGNIELTLDTICFYGIDLSKRIYIEGITESPMNIIDIRYNISNFTVNLSLENSRGYRRTVSLPTRGE